MTVFYKFTMPNGEIETDVARVHGDIHVEPPEDTRYGKKVPLKGNTYHHKDTIKSTDWDEVHHEWTGDYWRADLDTWNIVLEKLLMNGVAVTAHPDAVHGCDGLEEYHGEVELDEDGNEVFRFHRGPVEGDERTSRSWAEDAAKVGNFDSVEEFADKFNLEVVDDKELYDDLKGTGDDSELVSSADM